MGDSNVLPDRPEIRGMLAPGPPPGHGRSGGQRTDRQRRRTEIRVDELKPAAGSTKARRRVGRGIGGHGGKTAGRGTKGQKARNTVARGFEGGQMPLKQRVPKLKGFNNPFRIEYQGINLDVLEASGLTEVTPATLHAHGLTHKGALIKVLGRGEITRAVHVKAHGFSKAAAAGHHGGRGYRGDLAACPTRRAVRRPRATSSPTADLDPVLRPGCLQGATACSPT